MATVTNSFCIDGIDAYRVIVETDCIKGMPSLNIIGLGDQAVMEAADRIRSAITRLGFTFPSAKITFNLAPGDMKKRGSHYDLAMAISMLKNTDQISADNLDSYGIIGELSLNGLLRSCSGILPMVIEAKRLGIKRLILPAENLAEARLINGIETMGFEELSEVISFIEGKSCYKDPAAHNNDPTIFVDEKDFSEVKGQTELINAVILSAAGGHNLLMIGEPGCGKTMIAERIPGILPSMSEAEAIEVTKIQSVKGILRPGHSLVSERPFRQPHHNVSVSALVGGGNNASPGEVSLAHNGVLFLDELPEFPRAVLESLRQPLENRTVTVSRVNGTHSFPASFMLVAAMNPCPCGYYPGRRCRCSDYEIKRYRSRISGPILERIDIQKNVKATDYFKRDSGQASYSSSDIKARVETAREIQRKRFKESPNIFCNAQMNPSLISEYCTINLETQSILEEAADKYSFSARVITKLLRLARTSADLRESDSISAEDMRFVLSCRDLDRSMEDDFFTV